MGLTGKPNFQKIRVVVNPRAGFVRWKDPALRVIRDFLSRRGIQWEVRFIERKGHGRELAEEAAQQGFDLVLALGGDGTVNACASGLVGSDTCLGVLPAGSGNGMARGLRVPLSIRKALRLLDEGVVGQIDAGKMNGTYFFVTSGIGFDAEIGHEFDHRQLRGLLPYFAIGIRRFFQYSPGVVRVEMNGQRLERRALQVTVANMHQYGGGAIIAPGARPNDGMLDLCIVHEVSFLPALYYLPRLFLGTLNTVPYVELYRAREFVIERPSPGPYHCDGEPFIGGQVLRAQVLPRALWVLAARGSGIGEGPSVAETVESQGRGGGESNR